MIKQRTQSIDQGTVDAMERIRDAARSGERDRLDYAVSIETAQRPHSVEVANTASAAYMELGDAETAALMLAFSLLVSGRTPVMVAKLSDRLRERGLEALAQAVQKTPGR